MRWPLPRSQLVALAGLSMPPSSDHESCSLRRRSGVSAGWKSGDIGASWYMVGGVMHMMLVVRGDRGGDQSELAGGCNSGAVLAVWGVDTELVVTASSSSLERTTSTGRRTGRRVRTGWCAEMNWTESSLSSGS